MWYLMDIKSLLQPHFPNIKQALLDPTILYHVNGEIVYLFTLQKFKFDKFASLDGILGTSLSIRSKKPQIKIEANGMLGDISKKTALFVADIPSHEILNAISLIRCHGGICDKCIVVMDTGDMSDMFKDHKVELYSIVKKSDFRNTITAGNI